MPGHRGGARALLSLTSPDFDRTSRQACLQFTLRAAPDLIVSAPL